MTRQWMVAALLLCASVASADEKTFEKYEAEGQKVIAEINGYSDRDLALLSRTTGWNVFRTYVKGRAFAERVAEEQDLTNEEKGKLIQLVGQPTGRLIVRFNDGFVDGKVIQRTFEDLRQQGWDPIRAFLIKVGDWFVRREVAPFRFRQRPSEGIWSYAVPAAVRALFDRAVRITVPTLRSWGRILWPRQSYNGQAYWTVPPAWPILGTDMIRADVAKDIARDVNHEIDEAGKSDNLWRLLALGPIVAGLKESEPFRLEWQNRSVGRWMVAAAVWLFFNPVEFTRREMGGLEYGAAEAVFFFVAWVAHHYNAGIGAYVTGRKALARLEGEGDLAAKAAQCSLLLAKGVTPTPDAGVAAPAEVQHGVAP